MASLLMAISTGAQEALQNSLAGETAATSRNEQMQNPDYTYKNGDFRLLVEPSLSAQWNDNVNLSETNRMDDYIVTPSVEIDSSYRLTQRNVLSLDITVGYSRYLKEPGLSTLNLDSSSGTGLSFDIGFQDVTINLHDRISYVQDSAQNADVANTSTYGTFENTIGLDAIWDLNQVTLSAGYDHQNVLSTSSEYDYINHSAELFFIRSGLQVHPQVTVGLEATAGLTTYDQSASLNNLNGLNNNVAYTVGPYVEFQPDDYFQVTLRGGYSIYLFQQSNLPYQIPNEDSWYAGLTISHKLRETISYALDAGHEVQLGTESNLTEDWYVRPSINWRVIHGWDLDTGFFFTHGTEIGESVASLVDQQSTQNEVYDWYGCDLKIAHAITAQLTMSLDYRVTQRTSNLPGNNYTQNLVGLSLTYLPK
jgi:hypothetical protein